MKSVSEALSAKTVSNSAALILGFKSRFYTLLITPHLQLCLDYSEVHGLYT